MKQVGKLLLIIALVFEYIGLAMVLAALAMVEDSAVMSLLLISLVISIPLIVLETIGVMKADGSKNWLTFLLVLGIISVLLGLSNGTFNIGGTLLIIGSALMLSDKSESY